MRTSESTRRPCAPPSRHPHHRTPIPHRPRPTSMSGEPRKSPGRRASASTTSGGLSLECFLDYLADHEHIEREHVSFDHFDRQHLKGWLASLVAERPYAHLSLIH